MKRKLYLLFKLETLPLCGFLFWSLAAYIMRLVFIPCISLAGEDSLHEGLRWHPFDWQHGTTTFSVIAGSEKRSKIRFPFITSLEEKRKR